MGSAQRRAIGVDYGAERIGIAVSDELNQLAHPRPFIAVKSLDQAVNALGELSEREGVDLFVVGLPLSLSGHEGPSARRARDFGARLAQTTGHEVQYLDERLSTVQAARRLREAGRRSRQARGHIDSAAAAVLLQCWLDRTAGSDHDS